MTPTRASFALALLLVAAPLVADSSFDLQPTTPAQPTANEPFSVSVSHMGCVDSVDYTVVRHDTVIELEYLDGETCAWVWSIVTEVPMEPLPAGNYDVRLVQVFGDVRLVTDETILTVAPRPCPADTLCLLDGHVQVTGTWRDYAGRSGVAHPVALTRETGVFWFFDASNYEVMLKALDACAVNDHFWIYAGGLTDVEVDLHVQVPSWEQTYSNALGTLFEPIRDTQSLGCTALAKGSAGACVVGQARAMTPP